ncbi:MAG: hypothetical protein K6E95_03810 [Lachnospiraceae bacterium]|nr:hypothetical protein [Lachnospiraceae bacterium]
MAIINHKLDLVIRLIDASTGRPIDEKNTSFARDGVPMRMADKGGGVYFLVNAGREGFELTTDIYGYEAKKTSIDYGELDERIPEKLIWLMPKNALSLEGTLKGVSSLCAVRLVTPSCFVNSYDARKNIITLFNPHNLIMRYHEYGILDADRKSFEPIYVSEEDGIRTIRPAEPLRRTPGINDPIERIIQGSTSEDGGYLLKVRDDADTIEVLVRYVIDDREYFQKVEMHDVRPNELNTAKAFEIGSEKETEVETE